MAKKRRGKIVLKESEIPKECPLNPKWAARMLELGIEGKLAKFKKCPNVLEEMGYEVEIRKGE
mgnify:CR=1 FL=1